MGKRTLVDNPQSLEARYLLALALLQRGSIGDAASILEGIVDERKVFADAWNQLGLAYRALGKIEPAIRCFESAIAQSDSCASAHANLGATLSSVGRHEESIGHYERALAFDPGNTELKANFGFSLCALKRYAEAEPYLAAALQALPNSAALHGQIARVCKAVGRHTKALEHLERAAALEPHRAHRHVQLADALASSSRGNEAIAHYRRALEIEPDSAAIHNKLGVHLLVAKEPLEALGHFERAIELKPDFAEAHNNLGNARLAVARDEAAITAYEAALALRPGYRPAIINLAIALARAGRHAEAITRFEQALALRPRSAELHNQIGISMRSLDRIQDAADHFRRAIDLKKDYGEAYNNLGSALLWLNRPDEALACFARALAIMPDSALVRFNQGLAHLLLGEFKLGLPLYENRWDSGALKSLPAAPGRLWLGQPSIDGRSLLIQFEQGLGDAIQMARFIPPLCAQGAGCVLVAPESLTRLFRRTFTNARIATAGDELETDFRIPLMSLPLAMGVRSESQIPRDIPYLRADPLKVVEWRGRFQPHRMSIGVVWRGNPSHPRDRKRSVPLETLSRLFELESAHFVVLQRDVTTDERTRLSRFKNMSIVGGDFGDFDDTAACISAVDLVITIDSAPAHLAGALGVPTWILLAVNPDWRWMLNRADTPWYPSARLFRQTRDGDWDAVIARVTAELSELIGASTSRQAEVSTT